MATFLMIATASWAQTNYKTFTVNGVSIKMIKVEGGTFQMGATSEQESDEYDAKPVHSVTLSDYYIGETEVTQELWQAVCGVLPLGIKPRHSIGYIETIIDEMGPKRPVCHVHWEDCQSFILQLNILTGQHFRMPTEAEWEYAARGGKKSRGYKYVGTNNPQVMWDRYVKPDPDYSGPKIEGTRDVKSLWPNELGIYEMYGDLYEWCQDYYGNYSRDAQTNPTGPSRGSSRVQRGGRLGYGQASVRSWDSPASRDKRNGLRLVLSK